MPEFSFLKLIDPLQLYQKQTPARMFHYSVRHLGVTTSAFGGF